MDVFIARQPIFNADESLYGYELLYRDGTTTNSANITDGNFATSSLISDALTVFGMGTLTDSKPAFINFTKSLIMDDFALVLRPDEVVIELLEDMIVDDELLKKVVFLKERGYTIALDDYVGAKSYDKLLPLADVLKVDFRCLTEDQRRRIALRFKDSDILLLAEKVETYKEFQNAIKYGYKLFQGYFFAKPKTLTKKTAEAASSTYINVFNEVNCPEPHFSKIAKIVQTDAVLTYKLLQTMNSLKYYRGFQTTTVLGALSRMGIVEIRRWIVLMMAKNSGSGRSDELIKVSYIRGLFMQRLAEICGMEKRSEEAFLVGAFSLMDVILGMSVTDMVKMITLSPDIIKALTGDESSKFKYMLDFIIQYENCDISKVVPEFASLELDKEEILSLYIECIFEADSLFKEIT